MIKFFINIQSTTNRGVFHHGIFSCLLSHSAVVRYSITFTQASFYDDSAHKMIDKDLQKHSYHFQ